MTRRQIVLLCSVCLALAMSASVAGAAGVGKFERPARPAVVSQALVTASAATPSGGLLGMPRVQTEEGAIDALAADDNIPGDPLPPSPVIETVDHDLDLDDVYEFYFEQGQQVIFSLTAPAADIDLYLWGPGTSDVITESDWLAADFSGVYPKYISYVCPASGYYYVDVYAGIGASTYTLTWSKTLGPNGDIPAVAAPASPFWSWMDAGYDWDDVCNVYLNAGERLDLSLYVDPAYSSSDADFDIALFGPSATTVYDFADIVVFAQTANNPEVLSYVAPVAGYHYIDLFAGKGWGGYELTWSVAGMRPVYRFYNMRTGVHFYTASESEKANVIATLGAVYRYEGVAYSINTANLANDTPLYRFYNFRKGVHFYTASESEKANVIATLGSVYRLEGVGYYLAP